MTTNNGDAMPTVKIKMDSAGVSMSNLNIGVSGDAMFWLVQISGGLYRLVDGDDEENEMLGVLGIGIGL